jgi:arylsulfatase
MMCVLNASIPVPKIKNNPRPPHAPKTFMTEKPNVLLICTDHWPGRLGGWTGASCVQTPTIDRIASNGITFSNAYSACPICVPARRTLMTGLGTRGHGTRSNKSIPMPDAPTIADCFREQGYQTCAVGKLHVSPQRSRIGFDDVISCEEGRHPVDMPDDWELFLADRGYRGMQYARGATQNDYLVTPWHLPDDCHPTSWAAREMSRTLVRRERDRPGFWYLSFIGPHPPIWPIAPFLQQYEHLGIPEPVMGTWMENLRSHLPQILEGKQNNLAPCGAPPEAIAWVRRAFFATMTQIDYQIRAVIGTLRQERLLQNTVIAFTSDHGDMLGNHGLWGKTVFYEGSTKIPFIISPPNSLDVGERGRTDNRLVELGDMVPSLLELCGIPVPSGVEAKSVFSETHRDLLFGEFGDRHSATRMIRKGSYKLIYYADGNQFQLFDLENDPEEIEDLAADPGHLQVLADLQKALEEHLYGEDTEWVQDGTWVGLPKSEKKSNGDFAYGGQRGYRF